MKAERIVSAQTPSKSSDILDILLDQIGPIDFKLLAFPDIEIIKAEIKELKTFVFEKDGSYSEKNTKEVKRYQQLQKQLGSYKLNRNHYLILCIEQLLTIAETNDWGLCKRSGFIYIYNGEYWKAVDKERFQYFLGRTAMAMGVDRFTAKSFKFSEDLYRTFMAVAYLLTPEADKEKVFINLQNGTFEISATKQQLRPFDRGDFLKHQLPFKYDPRAKAPLFQKYLDEVLPDVNKQKVLAEYIASVFISTSVLKLEKVLILYGEGANGKSVFFEIINALLGKENVSNYSLQSLTDNSGYYRAKIADVLVNYASEMNGRLEINLFKQLASGEPVEARLPYGEPLNVKDYAKLIFNCNELPKDVQHTRAFFRRFLVIHFDVSIPDNKKDVNLSKKITQNELSGVFNWVLDGLKRLLAQSDYTKCEAIEKALDQYKKQSDSVKQFIDEEGYEPSNNAYTLLKSLYQEYRRFCSEDGFKPVSKTNFSKRLAHYNINSKRMAPGMVVLISKKLSDESREF
ncbi:DNA primase [Maribacter sp. ANRC-HE7]|uniref:DNA primase n=2 Tax=Maribacter aquimaris TaxID=2737171 RepID=A0ABR7V3I8_9FLAO|nr:DNA primase [Maribacter aquimaris]